MRARYFLPIIVATCLAISGCKKDNDAVEMECREVKEALKTENKEYLRSQIDRLIANLSSTVHNADNLKALVDAINGECSLNASIICVKCVYTLPEQSELTVTFYEAGTKITRFIDIIGTQDGKMRFASVHS